MPADLLVGLSPGTLVLKLAAKTVAARVAEAEKAAGAIALWQEAVALEDQLAYSEPADWFYPTRHYLGAAMLEAGDAKGAEAVYRADLKKNANNGWALFGVWKALEAQGKKGPAAAAEKQFKKAWAAADFELKRTAF
jgi:tetratricopeptide (TPR) repeat protein